MTEKKNGCDPFTPSESAFDTYTDVAIMSTTDMHGKCWSENEEVPDESVQDLIAEYITRKTEEKGALTPDDFNWKWEIA